MVAAAASRAPPQRRGRGGRGRRPTRSGAPRARPGGTPSKRSVRASTAASPPSRTSARIARTAATGSSPAALGRGSRPASSPGATPRRSSRVSTPADPTGAPPATRSLQPRARITRSRRRDAATERALEVVEVRRSRPVVGVVAVAVGDGDQPLDEQLEPRRRSTRGPGRRGASGSTASHPRVSKWARRPRRSRGRRRGRHQAADPDVAGRLSGGCPATTATVPTVSAAAHTSGSRRVRRDRAGRRCRRRGRSRPGRTRRSGASGPRRRAGRAGSAAGSACPARAAGTMASTTRSTFTGSVSWVMPRRFTRRPTWVSTGNPGRSRATERTTLAVLRPTPGSVTRSSMRAGHLAAVARRRARAAIPMSDFDFWRKNPVDWMSASSSRGVGGGQGGGVGVAGEQRRGHAS